MSDELPRRFVPGACRTRDDPYALAMALRSVGRGWEELVREACQAVWDHGLVVVQVKEKFGRLMVYPRPADGSYPPSTPQNLDELWATLRRTEAASTRTCERCGAPGAHYTSIEMLPAQADGRPHYPFFWRKTLCSPHAYAYYALEERAWDCACVDYDPESELFG